MYSVWLAIRNFKSIKFACIELKPVTILIGPPDSGKSNTIEALGLLTALAYGGNLAHYFRVRRLTGLLTDYGETRFEIGLLLQQESGTTGFVTAFSRVERGLDFACTIQYLVNVKLPQDSHSFPSLSLAGYSKAVEEWYYVESTEFREYELSPPLPDISIREPSLEEALVTATRMLNHEVRTLRYFYLPVRMYRLATTFPIKEDLGLDLALHPSLARVISLLRRYLLLPPHGENICELMCIQETVRELIEEAIEELGYKRVVVARHEFAPEGEPMFEKTSPRGISLLISPSCVAHGLYVYILSRVALRTGLPKGLLKLIPEIIALEEPEVHVFPYFVKRLAEEIASIVQSEEDKFIVLTTHNPYMLITLLEKVPFYKLAVYWVYRERDGYTRYYRLTEDELREAMRYGSGLLFTIESIIHEKLEIEGQSQG